MACTSEGPSSKVELILSAKNLRDKDILSRSDPVCVVYATFQTQSGFNGEYIDRLKEIGRTERINNCLNPQWNQKIRLHYYFESKQPLKFEM